MEIIQKYKANDGKVFNSSDECIKYEKLFIKVDQIMKDLNPLPTEDSCRFGNGGGYIQQDKAVVEKARKEITKLGNTFFKQKEKWSFSMIGRLFNDSGYDCLYSAWGRLSHIDIYWREWGQGYYAYNPDKGVQKPFINNEK